MVNAIAGMLYMALTGDYPGYAVVGFEEDSALIGALLSARGMVIA